MLYYASVDWPLTRRSLPPWPSRHSPPSLRLSPGTSSILSTGHGDWRELMNYKSPSDALTRPTWYARTQITAIHAFCICKCPSIINVMSLPEQQLSWMSNMCHAAVLPNLCARFDRPDFRHSGVADQVLNARSWSMTYYHLKCWRLPLGPHTVSTAFDLMLDTEQ